MSLVCLVFLACVQLALPPGDDGARKVSCEPVHSSCAILEDEELAQVRSWCSIASPCVELHPLIFTLRIRVPAIVERRI